MLRRLVVAATVATAACAPQPSPPPAPPAAEPAPAGPTPVEPAPADAAAALTAPAPPDAAPPPPPDAAPVARAPGCHADKVHCCMPDGTLVRPGGCQPSYPPGVQPATRRKPDGTCEQIRCYLRCLPATARIATPRGAIEVSRLHVGDTVYTADAAGRRVPAPILRMNRVPTGDSHTIVEVTLDDGRVVRASPGHPTADGTLLGDLARGATLDGAAIVRIRRIPYPHQHTWDLLPAGPTRSYWADGVHLGSTLEH